MFVQLLLEHLEAISPDHNDLLHELLQDLGDVPDVETFLGSVSNNLLFFNQSQVSYGVFIILHSAA